MKLPRDAMTEKNLDELKDESDSEEMEHWIKTDEECKWTCMVTGINYILQFKSSSFIMMIDYASFAT